MSNYINEKINYKDIIWKYKCKVLENIRVRIEYGTSEDDTVSELIETEDFYFVVHIVLFDGFCLMCTYMLFLFNVYDI